MEAPILYVRPNVTEEKSLTCLRRKKGNIPKEQDVPTLSPYTRTDPFLTLKLCSGLPSVGETGYCWYGKLEKRQGFTFKMREN